MKLTFDPKKQYVALIHTTFATFKQGDNHQSGENKDIVADNEQGVFIIINHKDVVTLVPYHAALQVDIKDLEAESVIVLPKKK